MPILDKNNEQEVKEYKEFMSRTPYRAITQDPAWARVKEGWGSEYVYLRENGEIIAALSLLVRKIPGGYSLLYAPRGPVCDINDIETVQKLVNEAEPVAKKHKAFALKMDPEVRYDQELHNRYHRHGFTVRNREAEIEELIQPRNNMILYLEDHDEESIMTKFSSRNRNKVRSSARKGVYTTWDTTDEYIQKFYEVYTFMAERNEITHRDIHYFYRMRDAYGDQLRVYLAHHEDDILAGAVTVNYYGKLYYLYGGSNNTKRNKQPNQRMQYEMIKWGIETGADQYDFGGVLKMDDDDGLYHFKKQFCYEDGVTEYIGEIDHVYNKMLYNLYTHGVPKMQKLKKKLKVNR